MKKGHHEKTNDKPPLSANGDPMKYWFPAQRYHGTLGQMRRHDEPVGIADNAHREFWYDREAWIDRAVSAEALAIEQQKTLEDCMSILGKYLVPEANGLDRPQDAISALLRILDGPQMRQLKTRFDEVFPDA